MGPSTSLHFHRSHTVNGGYMRFKPPITRSESQPDRGRQSQSRFVYKATRLWTHCLCHLDNNVGYSLPARNRRFLSSLFFHAILITWYFFYIVDLNTNAGSHQQRFPWTVSFVFKWCNCRHCAPPPPHTR